MLNQFPPAPVEMIMPAAYAGIVRNTFIVLAFVALWMAYEAYKTRRFTPMLILCGAAVACVNEPIYNILGCVWYPQFGHDPLYRLFGISVPLWVGAGYMLYVGGLGYWVYRKFERGMSIRFLWGFYLAGWVLNFVLEAPPLSQGVYTYYGPQPFVVLGLPLWNPMGNALGPIVVGALIYGWREYFRGARALLIIPSIPVAHLIALICIGWPIFLALHSGRGLEVTYPAALMSLALALMLVSMIGFQLCSPSDPERR